MPALGCHDASELIAKVQDSVGDRYLVTGSQSQIEASEDHRRGGRTDDTARAREIEETFADSNVVAAIALRGGAWLTRILPLIDFDILGRRTKKLAIFGFSEITPLINIAAQYENVCAYHDLCPGYLLTGLSDYARRNYHRIKLAATDSHEKFEAFVKKWAADRVHSEFDDFFKDAVSIIEGRGSKRPLTGQWLRGESPFNREAKIVGGNLTTLVALVGSRFASALEPAGRWLLIEDVRETPDRVDRLLSHLSLAGWLTQYQGILLGRFNDAHEDHTAAVIECLEHHLGRTQLPVVVTGDVGHVWPMSPVPLGRAIRWQPSGTPSQSRQVLASVDWHDLRIVAPE